MADSFEVLGTHLTTRALISNSKLVNAATAQQLFDPEPPPPTPPTTNIGFWGVLQSSS